MDKVTITDTKKDGANNHTKEKVLPFLGANRQKQ
jgi:hypothetical protein